MISAAAQGGQWRLAVDVLRLMVNDQMLSDKTSETQRTEQMTSCESPRGSKDYSKRCQLQQCHQRLREGSPVEASTAVAKVHE